MNDEHVAEEAVGILPLIPEKKNKTRENIVLHALHNQIRRPLLLCAIHGAVLIEADQDVDDLAHAAHLSSWRASRIGSPRLQPHPAAARAAKCLARRAGEDAASSGSPGKIPKSCSWRAWARRL